MKSSTNTGKLPVLLGGSLLVLGLWQAVCWLAQLPEFVLPSPLRVAQALAEDWALLAFHLQDTVLVTVAGFGLSLAAALGTGLLLDRFRRLERLVHPFLVVSQTVPTIFLYPLLLIWMGFGLAPRLTIVFLACFFPILVAFLQGLRGTNQGYLDLYTSLGARPSQIFFQVRLPSSLPSLFGGLRIAAAYPVLSAVVSEWYGSKTGLGVYMSRSFKGFETAHVFAGIFLVSLLSILFYTGIAWLEKKLITHHNKEK